MNLLTHLSNFVILAMLLFSRRRTCILKIFKQYSLIFIMLFLMGIACNFCALSANNGKMPIIMEAYKFSQKYGWLCIRSIPYVCLEDEKHSVKFWKEARLPILCDFIYIPYFSFCFSSIGDWLICSPFIIFWLRYFALLKEEKVNKNKQGGH